MAIRQRRTWSDSNTAACSEKKETVAALDSDSGGAGKHCRIYNPQRIRTGGATGRHYGHVAGRCAKARSHLQHLHGPGAGSPVNDPVRPILSMERGVPVVVTRYTRHFTVHASFPAPAWTVGAPATRASCRGIDRCYSG